MRGLCYFQQILTHTLVPVHTVPVHHQTAEPESFDNQDTYVKQYQLTLEKSRQGLLVLEIA